MTKKYKIVFFSITFIVLLAWFFLAGRFFLYYSEQSHLFIFSKLYLYNFLKEPGGIAQYCGNFLLQFNAILWLGPVISSLTICYIAMLSKKVLEELGCNERLAVIAIVIAVPFMVLHLNHNYYLGGSVAFIFALLALLISMKINNKLPVFTLFLSLILFWFTGPVVYQYLILLIITQIVRKRSSGNVIASILVLLIFVAIGLVSVQLGFTGDYEKMFLPDYYFEPRLEAPILIYIPFASLLLLVATIPFLSKIFANTKSLIVQGINAIVIIVFIIFTLNSSIHKSNINNSKLMELDYYSCTAQWDKIINTVDDYIDNYLYLNYLNLALLQEGRLANEMFAYDQKGVFSLSIEWDDSRTLPNVISDVAFAAARVSLSQRYAFESSISYHGSLSGRSLKRLVETNLITGEYKVAEKYLEYLSGNPFYSRWAREHKKYLYNDSLLLQDETLGSLRKSIPMSDKLLGMESTPAELDAIIKINPGNKKVVEYMIAYLLLNKDVSLIKYFVETYHGTEVLKDVPLHLQEAIIIYSEQQEEYWREYGVSNQVISRYNEFKTMYLQNKNKSNPARLLKASYGDSYWYYFIFK